MPTETLFPLPDPTPIPAEGRGVPRLVRPDRAQMSCLPQALDDLLEPEHPARAIWAYVEGLDLTELYALIRAVEGGVGRAATDPQLFLALWMLAIADGVGSARQLAQLCEHHAAYRWMCGGVSVNYHTLSDFRVGHEALLDRLLTRGVAALMAEELVSLVRVAQDGVRVRVRVRASAGTSSFRRKATLDTCLAAAQDQVAILKKELATDPAAGSRRDRAARERAARERQERVERARRRADAVQMRQEEKARANRKTTAKKPEVRASTTDPEATVMKMADGGYRPAFNVQYATTTTGGVIAGVAVTNRGTDEEDLVPMHGQLAARYGRGPQEVLADGGFATKIQIEAMAAPDRACTLYTPVWKAHTPDGDPYAPKRDDGPGVVAWRARMATAEADTIYRQRAWTAEWANAQVRLDGLVRFTVRGIAKCRTVALWHALVHNLFTGLRLRRLAAQPA